MGTGGIAHDVTPDPLMRIFELGRREVRVGLVVGAVAALGGHAYGGVRAANISSLVDVRHYAEQARLKILDRLGQSIDIEDVKPPEPPKPREPPPPEPEPEPARPAPVAKAAEPARAPAAAEAGKVLTATPDPNEPEDLTDQGFVTGNGERFAGGTTASNGTSKTAVRSPAAVGSVAPGGTGTNPAPTAPAGEDRSRPPSLPSGNPCSGFPAEADMDQIDFGIVGLAAVVGPDGRAKSVSVTRDPGHGFGPYARSCAMRIRYGAPLDRDGNPTTKTFTFTIRFTR